MLILSPSSSGRREGIPWTIHSLTETQTDFGKFMNPIAVGYALRPTVVSNTNLSIYSSLNPACSWCFFMMNSYVDFSTELAILAAFLSSIFTSCLTLHCFSPVHHSSSFVLSKRRVGVVYVWRNLDMARDSRWRDHLVFSLD